MKSKRGAPRVLLDTTYMLPTFGIEVGQEIPKGLRRLNETRAEIYYSRFAILESLWVATRVVQDQNADLERFDLGLRSIMKGGRYSRLDEGPEVFSEGFRLFKLGHRDMIDNILYACSTLFELKLLTIDRELRKFVLDNKLEDTMIFPEQLDSF